MPQQKSEANKLASELKRGQVDGPTVGALHNFLFILFSAQPESQKECPFRAFLALHALRADGLFMSPKTTTQTLAKAKYLANIIAIVQAASLSDANSDGMIGYIA